MDRLVGFITLGLYLCLASAASAQAPPPPPTQYDGVTLDGGEPPAPKAPPAGFQFITWPGFKIGQNGSEVFLQLTGPVNYKLLRKGHRLYLTLDKVQVYLRNNFRPVITKHFKGTPVNKFFLKALKNDRIRLEIKLRRRSPFQVTTKTVGQYYYIVVNFPPAASNR